MSAVNCPIMLRDTASQTQEPAIEVPLLKALSSATRKQHTHLNQLILSHLPLALPPHTETPAPYAHGILAFASIYYTFESSWQILSDYEPLSELPLETAVVLSSLIHVHIPSLQRSERLCNDLSLLLDIPRSESAFRIRHPTSTQTRDFVRHIRETARERPHALIAYAWVLYMALFNGGRWIREQLSAARDISWISNHSGLDAAVAEDNTAGLSFWFFDSQDDGDDIKNDFKARLTDVGNMLSNAHKEDIIEEAKIIFERCTEIVLELDESQKQIVTTSSTAVDQGTLKWTKLQDFLSLVLPLVIMQLILVLVKRISGARIRAPLPFRSGNSKDD